VEGSSSGHVIYNGVEYARNATFTATATTTFTVDDSDMVVHRNAAVTHNSITYYEGDIFTAVESTFTVTYDPTVNGIGYNESNDSEVYNNAFIECGGNDELDRGWYSFDELLTGVSADFNFVTKPNGVAVDEDAMQRPIGNVGGWDNSEWWEVNGINGGDPEFLNQDQLDFRLSENSFLVDGGDVLSGLVTDRVGVFRDSAPDIGAHEYSSTTEAPPEETNFNATTTNATTVTIQ
jgi:hypothetical protein